ncbi:MAG: hypothetical protein UV78_C0008G0008 [Parcubacteria group bacterium GW2011_GWA2_43_17]|nr:MAG: hypothetical protein UV78_C0008G0008 [Parcubacteria group bacterium GW2011_GWA2_43_17]KKT94113.1 MAG: hypothetical protein UW91_C0005G0006 [Parcubacteria group bacterium GW2011_GWF2_45_11]KKT96501.1 MAG: hypothetical protein UW98_C0041G0006 [Parcubacteria group bacterium GW2011_GWC2_45_15]
MDEAEIIKKVEELKSILSKHKNKLGSLEKKLYQAISDYQKTLDEERLKDIRKQLSKYL